MRLPFRKDPPIDFFNEEQVLKKRLAEILNVQEGPEKAPERISSFKGYTCYHLIPRIAKNNQKFDLNILGEYFSLIYERPENSNKIYIYLISPKSAESLRIAFEVEEAVPGFYPYLADFSSEKHWIQNDYVFKDLPGVVEKLPNGTALLYAVSKDPQVINYLHKKKSILENYVLQKKKKSSDLSLLTSRLQNEIYLVKICLFAVSEEALEEGINLVKINLPPTKVKKKVLKEPDKVYEKMLPPKAKKVGELGPYPLIVTERVLHSSMLFPDPSVHHTTFTRTISTPIIQRKRESGFRIGVTEYGEEFILSPEDFYRHVYIIGQTGSGKTNLMKVIVSKLQKSPVFVIDPHGSLADELAITLENPIYLHPIKSPFGVNPLKLPPTEDRDQGILISIDVLMNLFTNVFNLPETAINVRYILQTVTRQIYKIGVDPTLAGIYRIVMSIYNGADIGIVNETFKEHEKMLRSMPDQSFISTLGRLQSFAEDPLLRKITSTTTIDLDSLINEKRPVLFSIPQSELGITASTLLCSSLLLNLYYTVLRRYQKGKKENVFVVIDEFQTLQSLPILANILSEARKFGLHLIIAHQYVEQLTEEVFQAAINNSGVKFLFQVSGDVQKFRTIDPAFGEEIVKILPSLPTGKCLVRVVTTPEDAQIPPLVLNVDKFEERIKRNLEDICTDKYTPEDIELTLEAINPIFKFIELPFPPKQKILYAIYKQGGEASAPQVYGHVSYLKDSTFNKLINTLSAEGYINIVRKGKGERILTLTSKFFEDFRKVAKSEKGKKLVDIALLWYLDRKYYVAPVKNIPSVRPDFVVIPYMNPYSIDYLKAIEVELEATTAEKKESHLIDTMKKNTPFKERHIWCFEEDYPVIQKYLPSVNKPTTVFVVTKDKGIKVIEPDKAEKSGESKTPEKTMEEKKIEDKSSEQPSSDKPKAEIKMVHIMKILGPKKVTELKRKGVIDEFLLKVSTAKSDEEIIKIADHLLNPEPEFLAELKTFCPEDLLDKAVKIVETHGEEIIPLLKEAKNEGVLEDTIELLLVEMNPDKTPGAEEKLLEQERESSSTITNLNEIKEDSSYLSTKIEEKLEEKKQIEQEKRGHELEKNIVQTTLQKDEKPLEDKTLEKTGRKKKLSDLILTETGVVQQLQIENRTIEVSSGNYKKLKRDLTMTAKLMLLDDEQKVYDLKNAPPGPYVLKLILKDNSEAKYYVRLV